MDLYYIPHITGDEALIDGDEFHHAIKVMRRSAGDELAFTDGRGHRYSGILRDIRRHEAAVEIQVRSHDPVPPYSIALAIAPTKNIKRTEWCYEKVTEIGVQRIIPLICTRSERRTVPAERLGKILVAAMKQSQSAYLPRLSVPMSFEEMMHSLEPADIRYICCRAEDAVSLEAHYQRGSDVSILIGPEGDFSPDELALARERGYLTLNLGQRRLRTETAGVVAVTGIHFMNQ